VNIIYYTINDRAAMLGIKFNNQKAI